MEQATIKVTYDGVEIIYDELTNLWTFELNGRARHATALSLAKEAIGKPEPKKKKSFQSIPVLRRVNAWEKHGFAVAHITSVIGKEYGTTYVWIVDDEDGKRQKVQAGHLFAKTLGNLELVKEWQAKEKQIKDLGIEQAATIKKMELVAISPELLNG